MKVVLAGAYGKLGSEILKSLLKAGHNVVAADMIEGNIEGVDKASFAFKKLDVTDKNALKGICNGADAVITTVGLTKTSATLTNYDIDYNGNLNLLNEAKAAGVKNFVYISVIKADKAPDVPMLHAKYLFEEELKKSGLTYVIHRPTGYFYDIVKVFRPMIENGKVTLLGKSLFMQTLLTPPTLPTSLLNTSATKTRPTTWAARKHGRMRRLQTCALRLRAKLRLSSALPHGCLTCWEVCPKTRKTASRLS